MQRHNIHLRDDQWTALCDRHAETGLCPAKQIRAAVTEYLDRYAKRRRDRRGLRPVTRERSNGKADGMFDSPAATATARR
jgi:hypothetical protein